MDGVQRKRALDDPDIPETNDQKRPALTSSSHTPDDASSQVKIDDESDTEIEIDGQFDQEEGQDFETYVADDCENEPIEGQVDFTSKDSPDDCDQNGKSRTNDAKASSPDTMQSQRSVSADTSSIITIRAIIVSKEAAMVIGKGGANAREIRERSGARVAVTDNVKFTIERILSVTGAIDTIAKAFGLIARTVLEESLEGQSGPDSKPFSIRLIIPHARMGSIIGKAGLKIKEIQEFSGARLNASEQMLPHSTERILAINGVADSIHIAIYHVAKILQEYPERAKGTIPYRPIGVYGAIHSAPSYTSGPDRYYQHDGSNGGKSRFAGALSAEVGAAGVPGRNSYAPPPVGSYYPSQYPLNSHVVQVVMQPPYQPQTTSRGGEPRSTSQQIIIPNHLVGCVIGKGGSKINEIRQMSGSHIKIQEAEGNSEERLVTITGTPESNHMALYLLQARLQAGSRRV